MSDFPWHNNEVVKKQRHYLPATADKEIKVRNVKHCIQSKYTIIYKVLSGINPTTSQGTKEVNKAVQINDGHQQTSTHFTYFILKMGLWQLMCYIGKCKGLSILTN